MGEIAHHQKHGNDGQTLGCQRRGGLDRQQCQRGLKPDQNAGADHAHQCHGDAHRHLQQDHQKQGSKARESHGHIVSHGGSAAEIDRGDA